MEPVLLLGNTDSKGCDQCEAWVHADIKCIVISQSHFRMLSESQHLGYVHPTSRTAPTNHLKPEPNYATNPIQAQFIKSAPSCVSAKQEILL